MLEIENRPLEKGQGMCSDTKENNEHRQCMYHSITILGCHTSDRSCHRANEVELNFRIPKKVLIECVSRSTRASQQSKPQCTCITNPPILRCAVRKTTLSENLSSPVTFEASAFQVLIQAMTTKMTFGSLHPLHSFPSLQIHHSHPTQIPRTTQQNNTCSKTCQQGQLQHNDKMHPTQDVDFPSLLT